MSSNIVPFNFDEHQVRVVMVNSEPWFVLADLCRVLDLSNPSMVAQRLDEADLSLTEVSSGGQRRQATTVNESGMYQVVLRSDKPEAVTFRRWITGTVLPEIRKTGSYGVQFQIPQTYAAALELAALQAREIESLAEKAAEDAPKVLFADSVAASKSTILVGELAKILRGNGVEIGQNRLFDLLRDEGFLIKRRGSDRNMPTQYSMERELFEIKETTVANPDGTIRVTKTPKVTGKGQTYFVNRYTEKAVA